MNDNPRKGCCARAAKPPDQGLSAAMGALSYTHLPIRRVWSCHSLVHPKKNDALACGKSISMRFQRKKARENSGGANDPAPGDRCTLCTPTGTITSAPPYRKSRSDRGAREVRTRGLGSFVSGSPSALLASAPSGLWPGSSQPGILAGARRCALATAVGEVHYEVGCGQRRNGSRRPTPHGAGHRSAHHSGKIGGQRAEKSTGAPPMAVVARRATRKAFAASKRSLQPKTIESRSGRSCVLLLLVAAYLGVASFMLSRLVPRRDTPKPKLQKPVLRVTREPFLPEYDPNAPIDKKFPYRVHASMMHVPKCGGTAFSSVVRCDYCAAAAGLSALLSV
eukprot:scaffold1954_cov268-Pinguiococcus_pyrenoidosus.AAC.124